MILVDTSVWIDHLRRGNSQLVERLEQGEVVTHAHVIGELACGNLRARTDVLAYLAELPRATTADEAEVHALITGRKLYGRGIGWIDAHLLASAMLDRWRLWTLDRPLLELATAIGVAAD